MKFVEDDENPREKTVMCEHGRGVIKDMEMMRAFATMLKMSWSKSQTK